MSTQWEFTHTMSLAATGTGHTPDIQISHIEQGVYKLSIDKEALHLTSQDLLDILDWCLLNARTLEQQAKEQAS